MERRSTPELLAPAGSMDALKAAVNAGANAVYLSGKNFGARYYADNFNQAQLEEALNYAHLRNKKVYVTVNTLVFDDELEKVADYLFWLYKVGADAVILQDIGVASICRELVPDLDMHASTQMTINSPEGVKWAAEFGFKRVVLARELSLKEVEEIVEETCGEIELEIFAHGALCYCYSGQCLLSSVIGGRSGNRGRCAQPCRKPYQLLQGNMDKYGKFTNSTPVPTDESYLLSTKDLALYPDLDKMSNMPLASLKIEGRMRSPEYVALVVSIYREALDELSKDHWTPDEIQYSKLKLAFNRGFTKGHLLETHKEFVMGWEAPGNRGLYLGKVVQENKRKQRERKKPNNKISIKIDSNLPDFLLEKGDGVVFILPDKRRYGMAVEQTPEYFNPHKLLLNTKKQIQHGTEVYLTRDVSLSREAKNIIKCTREDSGIPLDITMVWDQNTPILWGKFTQKDGKEFSFKYRADFEMETARKTPTSKEQISSQLKKTGGTPFVARDVKIDYSGKLFIPLGKLNNFRREFIEKAELELLKANKPTIESVETAGNHLTNINKEFKTVLSKAGPEIKPPMDIAIYTSSLKTLKGAINGGCKRIYFEPYLWEEFGREHPCEVSKWATYTERIQELIEDAHKACAASGSTLVWKWPSITPNIALKYLSKLINPILSMGITEIMVGNTGALNIIHKLNKPVQISGSAALNIWNHRTLGEFSKLLNRVTLSNELSKKELPILSSYNRNIPLEYVVQGNLESLTSEDCLPGGVQTKDNLKPPWAIEDEKNRIFPLIVDDYSRTHVLNSVELCLIDYIPDLYKAGLYNIVIDARGKTSEYAGSMVTIYRDGLNFIKKTPENIAKLNKLKVKVKKLAQGGITTGNFLESPQ
jgi:putative protease